MTVGAVSNKSRTRTSAPLLREGDRGPAVKKLQQRLNELGFQSGAADGVFGPKTEQAVKSFQKAHKLDADGVVGPRTDAALDKAHAKPGGKPDGKPVGGTAPAANLKQGSSGGAVRQLQDQLGKLGYKPGAADGKFGPKTKDALRHFQAHWGLATDGAYGPKSRAALNKALDGQKPPHPNANPTGGAGGVGGGNVPKSVQEAARQLLNSPNVSFWSGLSTGSDRKNFERLARGEKAYVNATGQYVTPKLSMMQALVEMSKRGPIMINALTGGQHSSNSNHYRGTAVDLDVSTGNASMISSVANKYGGRRNSETSHIHLDF